ncbi:endonuclease domain-containing protein [Streptomyces inhibens]
MEAVREFRESRDHRCDICKRQWQEGGSAFRIDHDSASCPSRGPSCGKCVPGYLCRLCNTQGLSWYELVGRSTTTVPVFEDCLRRYERRRWGTSLPGPTSRLPGSSTGTPRPAGPGPQRAPQTVPCGPGPHRRAAVR